MKSVRVRTQQEIMDYIKTHSHDGKLTKSLIDIAKEIGYSNATIHRALQALQGSGAIEIAPSSKPTEPNTIIYKGSARNEVDELIAKGVQLSTEIQDIGKKVDEFLQEAMYAFKHLQKQLDEKDSPADNFADRIVQVQDIPNSDLQIMTIRKEVQ